MNCSFCGTFLVWKRPNPSLPARWVCEEPFCGAKNPRLDAGPNPVMCHRCTKRPAVHAFGSPNGVCLGVCEECNKQGIILREEAMLLRAQLNDMRPARFKKTPPTDKEGEP